MPLLSRFSRAAAVTAAVAACLAAAGCGSSSSDPLSGLSAKQIATRATAYLKSAPSFTITGSAPYNGQTINLDLGFKGGKDCEGTMGMGSEGSVAMVVIGGTAWIKPDAAFWKSQGGSNGAAAAQLFAGKYLKAPTSSGNISQLTGICDVSQLAAHSVPADAAKGAYTTVGGQRVLALTDKAKDSTMYVTDTATPRIVKLVSKQPGNSGQFTITYGVPATITAPPASKTVNGSQFGL